MKAKFDHSQDEAANITSFYFEPEQPMQYTAGQFTELTIEHKNPDERGKKRWFTISSPPGEDLIRITTKFADQNGSSFKKAMRKLQPGDEVNLADAMGDFVLPKLIQTPLIFVAGGIGITPFASILSWLSLVDEQRPIKLLYAVHNEDEIVFQEIFEKLSLHATIIVDQPSAAWGGERGKLNAEKIIGLEKPSDDTLIYTSGPEHMIESLQKELAEAGVKKSQLVGDFFPNYQTY